MAIRERQGVRWSWLTVLSLGVILCSAWLGCSLEKNYNVLSFFFDGVPDPNAPTFVDEFGRVRLRGVTYYTHEPYAQESCSECHRGRTDASPSMMLTRVQPTVCLNCHPDTNSQFPVMHGPVASNDCLWCHHPHEATVSGLLKVASPELCLQCHDLQLTSLPQPPEHIELKRDCLDCHGPHGADNRSLLRPDWYPAGQPDTAEPATSAAPDSAIDSPGEESS